jgi:hypothetical protein
MKFERRAGFAVVCLLWAGLALGVAMAETAKFRTPTLSRPAALDVGRTVFRASQTLQLFPLGLALAFAAWGRLPRRAWASLAVAGLALVVQTAWLFPLLDARAQTLMAGGSPVGASPHAAYGMLEVVKVLALILASVLALAANTPSPGTRPRPPSGPG